MLLMTKLKKLEKSEMKRNKKTITMIIYLQKAREIFLKNEWLTEEMKKQDIRFAIATNLIKLSPYPTFHEEERQRLAEVNKEIDEFGMEKSNDLTCHVNWLQEKNTEIQKYKVEIEK